MKVKQSRIDEKAQIIAAKHRIIRLDADTHLVGVSLLAIAVCQLTQMYLTHRYREQAHSYKGSTVISGCRSV
ncbi:hypothetical protein EMIT0P265_140031 [Pseudomonas zeae]